jgi:hypothetical protein
LHDPVITDNAIIKMSVIFLKFILPLQCHFIRSRNSLSFESPGSNFNDCS